MHQIQEEIGIPKIDMHRVSDNHVVFTISPLPHGYGMTLGTSLRRVLLSSLPGAAVTAVKIEGISHEYSTVKGVHESVLDIVLNLKMLYIKKTTKDPSIINLNVSREGHVYAKDLKTPSDVQILNPDLYITSLEKGGKLQMEIRVEKGVGYSPAALRKETESNLIVIDANFSPIKKIRYDVEASRVGQMTNLDKLILEIETNGAITPEDALKFASSILRSYFSLFDTTGIPIEPEFMSDFSKIAQKEEEMKKTAAKQESYTPIEILGLSPRTLNALINGGIGSIEQLAKCTESKLNNLRGFGKKALTEVEDALKTRGLEITKE